MAEIIVDNFAGGGGASLGIETALERGMELPRSRAERLERWLNEQTDVA